MRSSLARGAALLAAMLVSHAALAQSGPALVQGWPSRPVRLLVPFAAGAGTNDIMARLVGQHLGAGLGQPVVIENRPGAGGIAGTDAAAKAAPDGYTFLMTNVSLVTSAYLYARLPYDPQKDFVPVTLVATAPLMLVVHPSVAARTLQELVALAKANPGRLTYGSGGVSSTPHRCGELFKSLAEIVARLQAEVGKVLRLPEVRERLAALGAEPVGSTPEEFGAFLRAENARWGRIIREKGIRSE